MTATVVRRHARPTRPTDVAAEAQPAVGWLYLLGGTLGVSAAIPIAFSYWMKRGVSLGGTLWSAIAMAAIYVVVRGAVLLLRGTSRHGKLLTIPVAFVLLQFVVLPTGLATYTTQAAAPVLGERTPADLGMRYEELKLTAEDGSRLATWYVPPDNGAVIVLRHGSGSTRTAVLDHAAFLAEAGYGVLMMDARGHGESEGSINELGWHGPTDIDAGVDHLRSLPEVRHVGVLGLSMGGEEALRAAAADDRIEAVVAEGVGVGTYEDSVALGAHAMARFINWTQYRLTDLLSDAPESSSVVGSIPAIAPRSVLLIAGAPEMERELGRLFAHAGGSNVHLWELPDTPHTGGLERHGSEYQRRVIAVFDAALLN